MIILLLATTAFSETIEESLSYLDVLSTLESLSASPGASLINIGETLEDGDIWAMWLDQNKDYNVLVIGFIEDDNTIATLQVLNLIEIALDQSSKIGSNILFVPMLSANSCNLDQEQNSYQQTSLSSKPTCLKNPDKDDLNSNCEDTCRSFFDNCDDSLSKLGTVSLKNLIETKKFDFIVGYFAGTGRYIVPKTAYFTGLSIPYDLKENDNCESLVEYGDSQGIVTVATFIPDRTDLSKNSDAFFSILSRLYPKLNYGAIYSKLEGYLKITLKNIGMKPTTTTELHIKFSDLVFNAALEMKYGNTVVKYPLHNVRSLITVGLPEIQPLQDVSVSIDFEYSEPVDFEIGVEDYELEHGTTGLSINMQMMVDPRYLIIGAIILIALIIPIRLIIKCMKEPRVIRIPNRFLPGQFPQYLK